MAAMFGGFNQALSGKRSQSVMTAVIVLLTTLTLVVAIGRMVLGEPDSVSPTPPKIEKLRTDPILTVPSRESEFKGLNKPRPSPQKNVKNSNSVP
jgi:hypothetical protein